MPPRPSTTGSQPILIRPISITCFARRLAGAIALDELTRDDPIELFLLFSSATTLLGAPGQGAYVAANLALEALARRRHAEGRPALADRVGTDRRCRLPGAATGDARGAGAPARRCPDPGLASLDGTAGNARQRTAGGQLRRRQLGRGKAHSAGTRDPAVFRNSSQSRGIRNRRAARRKPAEPRSGCSSDAAAAGSSPRRRAVSCDCRRTM